MDDAVIMIHSFARTDTRKDPVDRIADTMEDAGISISLTTCTSAAAFGLGCLSSIPVVIWLCVSQRCVSTCACALLPLPSKF